MTVSMAADTSGRFRRMPAGEAGAEIDFARQDFRVGRDQENVVEGQRFFENSHGGVRGVANHAGVCDADCQQMAPAHRVRPIFVKMARVNDPAFKPAFSRPTRRARPAPRRERDVYTRLAPQ